MASDTAKVVLLVAVFFGVVGAAILGISSIGNDWAQETESVQVTEGEDILQSVEVNGDLVVILSAPASEYGIAAVYLYHDQEQLASKQLDPRDQRLRFYGPTPTEGQTWELVAVDGSNRVISKIRITFPDDDGGEQR